MVRRLSFVLGLLIASQAYALPWICPPARVNTDFTVLGVDTQAKPAQYAVFYDSAYSTCRIRMTDVATRSLALGKNLHDLVPEYSQMQAWNADQTKIALVSENDPGIFIYDGISYQFIRKTAGVNNFQWSPIYPDTGYFHTGNQIKQINVVTDAITTLHTFSEYTSLETLIQEDMNNAGTMSAYVGYRSTFGRDTISVLAHFTNGSTAVTTPGGSTNGFVDVTTNMFVFSAADGKIPYGTKVTAKTNNNNITISNAWTGVSGDYPTAFVCSEAFVYHYDTDTKGTVKSGWAGWGRCRGIDGIQVSPSGKYMLIHWGVGACGDSCGMVAYDTAGVFKGKVLNNGGHVDVTIDEKGREYAVAFTTGADCGQLNGAYLAKFRIPNGYTQYVADGNVQNDTTAIYLISASDSLGGSHVSGRAMGKGFVIWSADKPNAGDAPEAFRDEIVKVYLNSTLSSPKFERLANHRSNEYRVSTSPCSLSKYWAQPHATISRDGTRVLWGSTWGSTYGSGGNDCVSESYVQDIYNTQRNEDLVNQTTNTWRRIKARSRKADGTGGGAADTTFPYMVYGQMSFSTEYGGIFYYGGGGHGGRRGNDVWYFNTGDTTFKQMYVPDSIYAYPVTTSSISSSTVIGGPYSMRSYMSWNGTPDPALLNADVIPSSQKPMGMTHPNNPTGSKPWSTHAYQQMTFDSRARKYIVYGPQVIFNEPIDSICPGGDAVTKPNVTITNGSNTITCGGCFTGLTTGMKIQSNILACDDAGTGGQGRSITSIPNSSTVVMDVNADGSGTESVTFGNQRPEGYFAFRAKGSYAYDPYKNSWAFLDTFPDLYAGDGAMAFDPIRRKSYAFNYDIAHTAGYGGLGINQWWYVDTTGTWTKPYRPPGGGNAPYLYGATALYSRKNNRIYFAQIGEVGNFVDTCMFYYDPDANVNPNSGFTKVNTTGDPAMGYLRPLHSDALAALSTKSNKILIHGRQNASGNADKWSRTWVYDIDNNQWKMMLPPTEPVSSDSTSVQDLNTPIVYDAVNNGFWMMRHTGLFADSGNGQTGGSGTITGETGELWFYKLDSGDGRIFNPTTPSFGGAGGPSCGTGGL